MYSYYNTTHNKGSECEISSSHSSEYEVQICLLGCTAMCALMMEAARTSETSVHNYFTWQYIPEDKSELQKAQKTSENAKKCFCAPSTPLTPTECTRINKWLTPLKCFVLLPRQFSWNTRVSDIRNLSDIWVPSPNFYIFHSLLRIPILFLMNFPSTCTLPHF
jgi:hypothetical protein